MNNGRTPEIMLRILSETGRPLDFEAIHEKSKLSAPSVTRQLRKGERLGLIDKSIERSSFSRELKCQWKITRKGKQIHRLYAEG
jgi:DNA-binding HxlR family transcriptional regulator